MGLHNISLPVKKSAAGFTAIEILVVVGVVALIAAFGAIIGLDAIGRSSVGSERDLYVTLLSGARDRALANVNQSAHGVRAEADTFILFEGTSYNPSDPDNQPIGRTTGIAVSGPENIIFEQLSGNALPASVGTITFSDGVQSDSVEINARGRIEW